MRLDAVVFVHIFTPLNVEATFSSNKKFKKKKKEFVGFTVTIRSKKGGRSIMAYQSLIFLLAIHADYFNKMFPDLLL